MTSMRSKLIAANWKMNGSYQANRAWLQAFARTAVDVEVAVCAPFVYLPQVVEALRGTRGAAGAQNLSAEAPGAYTGEVAAEMLVDCGVRWVIVRASDDFCQCPLL